MIDALQQWIAPALAIIAAMLHLERRLARVEARLEMLISFVGKEDKRK